MQGVQDSTSPVLPDVPEIRSPTELKNELVLNHQRGTRVHRLEHLGQVRQPVGEVG